MSNNNHKPEFILTDGDTVGIVVQTVQFFIEDIEKMKEMSLSDRIAYKGKLKEEGKYYYKEYNGNEDK